MTKIPRSVVLVAAGVLAGGIMAAGATVAIEAGATGTSTTYYACLSSKGALSKVGTVSPTTCSSTSTAISWNSQGPPGIQGVQGPAGLAQASSATSGTVALPGAPNGPAMVASTSLTLPSSEAIVVAATVHGLSGLNSVSGLVTCQLQVDANPVGLPASIGAAAYSQPGAFNIPLQALTPLLAAGTHTVEVDCQQSGNFVTVTGTITAIAAAPAS